MFMKLVMLNALGAILKGGLRFLQQPSTDNHLFLSRVITRATSICPSEVEICQNLVTPSTLVDKICASVNERTKGVKVLWAPKGSGKTVATRLAARQLVHRKDISGSIIVAASELDLNSGTPLLRQLCGRWGAEWGGQMSELFDRRSKPVLLLIDQIDNFMFNADGLARTQNLVKTLAEDSVLNNNFVVLAVCSNFKMAKALLDANGRQKIVPVTPVVSRYKWRRKSFDDLLDSLQSTGAGGLPNDVREELLGCATVAGTPGFFLRHLDSLLDVESIQVMRMRLRSMKAEAKEVAALWLRGEAALEIFPQYE